MDHFDERMNAMLNEVLCKPGEIYQRIDRTCGCQGNQFIRGGERTTTLTRKCPNHEQMPTTVRSVVK